MIKRVGEPAELAAWLQHNDYFGIVCHVSPDGDTIGSALALREALETMGKHACVLCHDEIPPCFHFMAGALDICTPETAPFTLRAMLFVDVSDPTRAGDCLLPEIEHRAVIDHHGTNPLFCGLCVVDSTAAATGVLVVELFDRMRVALTPTMAENLYIAISTDTGNFAYSNTDGRTLRTAANCLDAGVDAEKINRLMFRLRSRAQTALLACALSGMQYRFDGRLAIMQLSLADMAECSAVKSDTDGIINFARDVEGVDVAVMLYEDGNGGVKASLRSVGDYDVARIAANHGGGGHKNAAGATLNGALNECLDQLMPDFMSILGDDEAAAE